GSLCSIMASVSVPRLAACAWLGPNQPALAVTSGPNTVLGSTSVRSSLGRVTSGEVTSGPNSDGLSASPCCTVVGPPNMPGPACGPTSPWLGMPNAPPGGAPKSPGKPLMPAPDGAPYWPGP